MASGFAGERDSSMRINTRERMPAKMVTVYSHTCKNGAISQENYSASHVTRFAEDSKPSSCLQVGSEEQSRTGWGSAPV